MKITILQNGNLQLELEQSDKPFDHPNGTTNFILDELGDNDIYTMDGGDEWNRLFLDQKVWFINGINYNRFAELIKNGKTELMLSPQKFSEYNCVENGEQLSLR